MRPINKGGCPKDTNGNDKIVTDYKQWRKDLIKRIGEYCVYCNMPLSYNLQVEHVVPKIPQLGQVAGSLLAWENVLLACGPCNNAKSNKPSDASLHYLPEEHNTLLPFIERKEISPDGENAMLIGIAPGLSPAQQKKAADTITLFKWDDIDTRNEIVDLRWKKRWAATIQIKAARGLLEIIKQNPNYETMQDETGKNIAITAQGCGFFFLWYKEFENEPAVMKWLISQELYPGVAKACFDDGDYHPIGRNPNNIDPI